MSNMKKLLLFLVPLAAITFVVSQNCTTLLQNKGLQLEISLNLTKYAGVWYEVRRNKTSSLNRGDCSRGNLTLIRNSTDQLNTTLLEAWNNHKIKTRQNGFLNFTTPGNKNGNLTFINKVHQNTTNHWIMKTNYNYSILYSCSDNLAGNGEENVFILSRNKTISEESLREARDELKKYNPGKEPELIITNQTGECDKLFAGKNNGKPSGANGIVLFVHLLALTVFTKLL